MTPDHARWDEFASRLEGPEGCDIRMGDNGPRWTCDGEMTRPKAVAILRAMGFDEGSIRASLRFFQRRGGYCDCEILLNVDRAQR